MLLAVFVVQSIGIATMLAGVKYFADHVLRQPDDGPTLLFVLRRPALLVMPLWSRAGARWGKKRSLIAASLIFGVGALALLSAPVVPPAVTYAITAVIGCGYAGQQVFALAMLPDCIAYDEQRTGRRQAGVFTGLWTAGETFGLALGPGIFGLVIAVAGYRSSDTGVAAAQPTAPGSACCSASRCSRRCWSAWRCCCCAATTWSAPVGWSHDRRVAGPGRPGRAGARRAAGIAKADLPTHGGRLFAYVYDPAVSGLDELARPRTPSPPTSTASTRPRSRRCWRSRTRWSARRPRCWAAGRTWSAASPAAAPSR